MSGVTHSRPHLSELESVPTVDVSVQRDDGDLLRAVVVAERPHAVGALALLRLERLHELVGGDVGVGDLVDHLLGDAPEAEVAVPRARDEELVVDPSLVKDPVRVAALKKMRANLNG